MSPILIVFTVFLALCIIATTLLVLIGLAKSRKREAEREEFDDAWAGFIRAKERHAGPESRTDRLPYGGRVR